jgi:hypothetical protein
VTKCEDLLRQGLISVDLLVGLVILARLHQAGRAHPDQLGDDPQDAGMAPDPSCDCERDEPDCADFSTREEAQRCFDYCWVQVGGDVPHLDGDGDGAACEPTPVPGDELAALFVW